jgi:hypothetical protein
MRITFEGPLEYEAQLPDNLDETDVGRTWTIGFTWYVWAGHGWQQYLATRDKPA